MERFEDFFLICACTGQAAYLGRGELARQSGECQQQARQRVLGRNLLTASSYVHPTSFHLFFTEGAYNFGIFHVGPKAGNPLPHKALLKFTEGPKTEASKQPKMGPLLGEIFATNL